MSWTFDCWETLVSDSSHVSPCSICEDLDRRLPCHTRFPVQFLWGLRPRGLFSLRVPYPFFCQKPPSDAVFYMLVTQLGALPGHVLKLRLRKL